MGYTGGVVKNSPIITLLLNLLRLGMGAFFLCTSVLKVSGLGETADFLTRSRLLPELFSLPLACTGVAMEMLVGALLLCRRMYVGAALWGLVMCSVFLCLYAQAWARGLELSCNCTGTTHDIVNYPLDTGLRLLLVGAMLLLLWDAQRRAAAPRPPRPCDFSNTYF